MMIRLCLKSLPAIGYRRLVSDQFEPRNAFWYQHTFACCFRGFFGRFKSTRSGLFKSLTDTVSGKGKTPEEDIKITDAKSSKFEEDKTSKIVKNNPAKIQTERLNHNKIKPVTIDPGIAAPNIKINEKICVKNVQPEPEVLRELSDKVEKIKINQVKKSDDPFSQFQQLLTIPQLHADQKLNIKRRESTKKKSSPKSLSKGKFIPQQLAKNKTDPKLYENLTLLKDPEPQCEFLELQSGRKRIAIGGLSDVNQTNSKSNLPNSRTMTSQADNRPPQKSIVKKKSILPSDRLEKRLLLETPKIKAIKNRLSKMDRYWIIAAKKKTSEPKFSDSLLRLRDRICQQIEASKNFKYGIEPMRLAVVGNEEEVGDRPIEKFSKSRTDEVASSRNVLERVKIMNRKLKTEPYIPPLIKKKPLVKKNAGGKLILKKINKKEKKMAKALDGARKSDNAPLETTEKLYSGKIRAKIMKLSEKRKKIIAKEEALVGQAQEEEGPDAQYTPLENKIDPNPPEIVTATPIEIPPSTPENKPEEPSKPADEPKKPDYLEAKNEKTDNPQPPRPRLNFPKVNFPKRNSWNFKPRPQAEPTEEETKIRKPEPKPSMTLKSAMEGFKMDSAVNRIILQAKARAMGVKSEEMQVAPKESKETQKKKKLETIRKSTFFNKKKKSNKTKENILAVDKTDGVEIQDVAKRSRVPIKIPENVPGYNVDPKNPPPTQEEVAKKIRQWYQDRPGVDPNPSVQKEKAQIPTLEKVHPEASLWPIERTNKKEETKTEEIKTKTPTPVPTTEEIKKADESSASPTTNPVSNVPPVVEPRIEETKKADTNDRKPSELVSDSVVKDLAPSEAASPPEPRIEEIKREPNKKYNVWIPSDSVFQKKVEEEFVLKRPKSQVKRQDVKKIESVFKKAPKKVATPQSAEFHQPESTTKKQPIEEFHDPGLRTKKPQIEEFHKPESSAKKQPIEEFHNPGLRTKKPQFEEFHKPESSTKKPQVVEIRKSESRRGKREEKKYDTRVGSTIKKESMGLSEKPVMVIKNTGKPEKSKKVVEAEMKLDPVVIPVAEEPPKLEAAPKFEETSKIEEPPKLKEPLKLAEPLQSEEPLKLEEQSKWEEPMKLEESVRWEEPLKIEETTQSTPKPQSTSIDPPSVPEVKFDPIATNPITTVEIRKIPTMASKEEDNQLKGAINIQLKPLSEIENLTKAVKEYEKRLEDNSGIDVFEGIISKKIETIPCAKPKLPPYYYTPYSSSTVEPEELPNKKEDKADEK